jgi:hypothetical protein
MGFTYVAQRVTTCGVGQSRGRVLQYIHIRIDKQTREAGREGRRVGNLEPGRHEELQPMSVSPAVGSLNFFLLLPKSCYSHLPCFPSSALGRRRLLYR